MLSNDYQTAFDAAVKNVSILNNYRIKDVNILHVLLYLVVVFHLSYQFKLFPRHLTLFAPGGGRGGV